MFHPVPGATKMVYSAGPPKGKQNVLTFQCPQSMITPDIWELLILWWNCRLLKCLPQAGGFLDQSKTVRDSFPIFEGQYRIVEQQQGQHGAMASAQMALVGLMAALGK